MDEAISRTIGEFYEAAATPEAWSRAMISLMNLLETSSAYVLIQQRQQSRAELAAGAGIDPEYMKVFNERYIAYSPCLKSVRSAEMSALGATGFEKTEFFNDFLKPQNLYWGLMGRLSVDEREVWSFSASRGQGADPFGSRDFEVLGAVLPHLRRAFFLQRQLASARVARAAAEAALDVLVHGVVLLGATGRVQHLNASAQRIVDRKQGLAISREGFLIADDRAESARLALLVRAAAGAPKLPRVGGAIALSDRSRQRSLSVVVAPLGRDEDPLSRFGATVAVFVTGPEASSSGMESRLGALFGLSPAESRVAVALIEGHDPKRMSELLHVSLPTIRTHLRAIFQRTGTRGQSDLVRLLLQSPPVLETR